MFQILNNVLSKSDIDFVMTFATNTHHTDEHGHGDGGGHGANKPNYIPMIADRIEQAIHIKVDPWSKLYRFEPNSGAVEQHTDKDFVTPTGLRAEWSVLAYLTDDYEGGETIFDSIHVCPHLTAGSVLVFPHNLLHEGRKVIKGTKIVLKTDLLFHV